MERPSVGLSGFTTRTEPVVVFRYRATAAAKPLPPPCCSKTCASNPKVADRYTPEAAVTIAEQQAAPGLHVKDSSSVSEVVSKLKKELLLTE